MNPIILAVVFEELGTACSRIATRLQGLTGQPGVKLAEACTRQIDLPFAGQAPKSTVAEKEAARSAQPTGTGSASSGGPEVSENLEPGDPEPGNLEPEDPEPENSESEDAPFTAEQAADPSFPRARLEKYLMPRKIKIVTGTLVGDLRKQVIELLNAPPKRGRGRPRKDASPPSPPSPASDSGSQAASPPPGGRDALSETDGRGEVQRIVEGMSDSQRNALATLVLDGAEVASAPPEVIAAAVAEAVPTVEGLTAAVQAAQSKPSEAVAAAQPEPAKAEPSTSPAPALPDWLAEGVAPGPLALKVIQKAETRFNGGPLNYWLKKGDGPPPAFEDAKKISAHLKSMIAQPDGTPAKKAATAYTERVGCAAKGRPAECALCPFGAAQAALCVTMLDEDTTPGGAKAVVRGELLVRVVDPNFSDSKGILDRNTGSAKIAEAKG